MTLTTGANAAFTATGGGTVNVCDENPCNPAATGTLVNTLTTTTGTALNVANTTIGASGLDVPQHLGQRRGQRDRAQQHRLSGGLTVSGDGSQTTGLFDRDGSGGTITNTTGHAVALTNASNVTLRQMNITNTATNADGINSSGGSNFTLLAALIDSPGGHGINLTNIGGANTINQNTVIEDFNTLTKSGIEIRNTNTNFTSITIGTNTAVDDDTKIRNSVTGSDGILFVAMGATTGAVTVQNMEFAGLDQDAVQISNDGSGVITSVIRSSNFHDADNTVIGGIADGNNTVFLSQSGSGDHNFTIGGATAAEGNSFTNLGRLGVLAGVVQVNVNGAASAAAQVNGTIRHNTVTGSTGRRGIMFLAEASGGAQGGHTVSILDNTVSNTFHGSIYAIFSSLNNSDNLGNSLTVSRNNVNTTVGNSGGDSASAIEIEYAVGAGSSGSDIAATIMLEDNIAVNNTTSGLGDTIEIVNRADVVGATGTMNVTAWGNTATNQAGGTNSAFEIRNFASAGGTLTMTLDLNAANNAANRNAFLIGRGQHHQRSGNNDVPHRRHGGRSADRCCGGHIPVGSQ